MILLTEPRPVEHGSQFTATVIAAVWTEGTGWSALRRLPLADLPMHPGMIGLHYGQVIFEGLKAHRRTDGSIAAFRPIENAHRFQRSARRLAMPELPVDMFMHAVEELMAADGHWLPDDPNLSLYLRPLMYGSEANLMLRPSREYRFLLMAFVVGGFFGDPVSSITVWVSHDFSRAIPGGTGDVKCAANYAGAFLAQGQAEAFGCQQVVWLDPVERRWVEELSGMNLFFVRGKEIITPPLSGSILPGVTRTSLLVLADRLGYPAREERVSLEQWRSECAQSVITETFACGTAAVITPVGAVRDPGGDWSIGGGTPGPVTVRLRRELVDLHHGIAPDPDGWMHPCPVSPDNPQLPSGQRDPRGAPAGWHG
jgi:branched-chain amino acid aminotransferase